jgi:sec-independent protein translocase protein TatA
MFEGIFQPTHLLVIFGIALLVFGAKKLPELGKGIGAGIRALKEGIKDPLIEPGKSVRAEPGPSSVENEGPTPSSARAS